MSDYKKSYNQLFVDSRGVLFTKRTYTGLGPIRRIQEDENALIHAIKVRGDQEALCLEIVRNWKF